MARWAFGTTLEFGAFSAEITDSVDGPGMERETIDKTHHLSPNGIRQKIPGLTDVGTLSITIQWDCDALPPIQGSTDDLIITWPPDTAAGETTGGIFETKAFLKSFSPSAPIDDKLTASCEFELTDEYTFTPAA